MDTLDPELEGLCELSANVPDVAEEVPCAIGEFFKAAEFDSMLGPGATAKLRAETSNFVKHVPPVAPGSAPAANAAGDPQRLEKFSPVTKFYASWVREQMEKLGKSATEVAEDWKREFPRANPEVTEAIEQAAASLT